MNKLQQDFENFTGRHFYLKTLSKYYDEDGEEYEDTEVQTAWEAWQEAKEGLPMLHSAEKEYKEKIKSLQNELDSVYASALRFATGVINRSKLSTEEKTDLISKLWEK